MHRQLNALRFANVIEQQLRANGNIDRNST